jgi:hypothetical protein
MTDNPTPAEPPVYTPPVEEEKDDEEFEPTATMVLTLLYLMIFATAWGMVYFLDLLGRR